MGHLIYSLSSVSTTFFVLSIILAIKLIFPEKNSAPENYLLLLIPIYVIFGLKRFYNRSWVNTIFKFVALSFIYSFSIWMTAGIVFVLSIIY